MDATLQAELASIREAINAVRFGADDAWGTQEVADFLKLDRKTVQNHIVTRKDFPKPYYTPTNGRRWRAGEVKAWFYHRPAGKLSPKL